MGGELHNEDNSFALTSHRGEEENFLVKVIISLLLHFMGKRTTRQIIVDSFTLASCYGGILEEVFFTLIAFRKKENLVGVIQMLARLDNHANLFVFMLVKGKSLDLLFKCRSEHDNSFFFVFGSFLMDQ